jgi:polar amino acid transport system substrate-binding protein
MKARPCGHEEGGRYVKKVLTILLAMSLVIAGSFALVGCGSQDPAPTPEETPEATAPTLETLTPGKLTIATGEPAYSPWVMNNDPESGEGFEAAVAYAVAEQLGFAKEDVVWVRTGFDAAITPGPKDFDFNIQQFSITEERKQSVDFSSAYYVTSQAVVALADNEFAGAQSLADLQGAKIGAATASTSLTVAQEKFQDVAVFNDHDAVVQALQSGQIDALVCDVPTAFFTIGAQLDGGKLVGEIEATQEGDGLGLLLPKDSPLTAAVTAAVDALRDNGTLARLAEEWLVYGEDGVVLR